MTQLQFYATRRDLIPVIEAVERVEPIKYALMGFSDKVDRPVYASGVLIPNLGQASSEGASTSSQFLVTFSNERFQAEPVELQGGAKTFLLDQLENPVSITFSPGGFWRDDVFLYGRVATVSGDARAQALLKRYIKEIKKNFSKVKSFWVGEEARQLLRSGIRLTIAAQSPREFDLTEVN